MKAVFNLNSKFMRPIFVSAVMVLSVLMFASCGGSGAPSVSSVLPSSSSQEVGTEDSGNYNWVIYVQDSSTITMGDMKMDLAIDLKAVNTSGNIYGQYIGSATTKAVSSMTTAKGSLNAPVEGKSTSLVINVSPSVSDEDKLAPLTSPDPDDDKLAPLVPSDDDKLAPLTGSQEKSDYEGSGSMTLQSGGTGTVTVRGVSVSRGIGNTSVNPLKVFITGTTVRLEVDIPEIGAVYFDGYIRGEGK